MRFEFKKTEAYERVRKNLIKDLSQADNDIKKVEDKATKKPNHGQTVSGKKYASEGQYTIRKIRGELKSSKGKGQRSSLRLIYIHKETSIIPLLIYEKKQFKQEKDVTSKVRKQFEEVKQELDIDNE